MAMKKRIVLCADDFGQALAISRGIISLLENNRLSATSCMVNTPYWPEHAKWLQPFRGKADIGLHFNLTEGSPISTEFIRAHGPDLIPLPAMLKKSFMRKLNQAAIEAECHAQIDRFLEVMGHLPDFIDGHQHVHQFPIVRSALMNVYEQKLRNNNCYVRLVSEKIKLSDIFHDMKKIIIYLSGTRALERLLNKKKIPYNHTFAGIYSFDKALSYGRLFRGFLAQASEGELIMCHPGLEASSGSDVIATARFQEYQYFTSDRFVIDCEENGVVLARFSLKFA
jgi:predicted glycoside hydrolase/deacetylase ChbG (UPF0249 family)